MKFLLTFSLIISSLIACSQEREVSMNDTELRREISMNDTEGKVEKGVYRYYVRGEDKPFTGILYGKYPNGQWLSRQEYVDGIGQGTWINYYENGNFKEVGTYEQNRVEGSIEKYYPNGNLQAEGTYREWRIRVGEWKYYNEKGEFVKTVNHGKKGDYRDVKALYESGDITKKYYDYLLIN